MYSIKDLKLPISFIDLNSNYTIYKIYIYF